MSKGLDVMQARGLRFLVSEYCAQLLCHWKETARVSQLTRSAEPATGEDVDLERHYEHLPLSPVLLAAGTSSMQNLREPTRLANLHAVLMDYKETVEKSIRSGDTGCLSLSSHEEILGCMCSYLHQKDYWNTFKGPRMRVKRMRAKKTRDPIADNTQDLFRVLLVFATSAWVELTEKWYNLPEAPGRHLRCVTNMSPIDYRSLGELVWAEVKESSQALYAHCCAQCGRLLHSRTAASHLPSDVGRPGMACQLWGRHETWTVMPPFLLLWSKQRLGHLLRAVCAYDATSGKLTLKGPWSTAPWLHLVPGTPKPRIEELTPWWYCIDCHDYFVPTVLEFISR